MQTPPDDPQAQLRWLVDRAQISDVLVEYARCSDAADWSGMGELFTEDGQAVFAAGTFLGRNFGAAAGPVMALFCGTHHLSANHAIHIDGDSLHCRISHYPFQKRQKICALCEGEKFSHRSLSIQFGWRDYCRKHAENE